MGKEGVERSHLLFKLRMYGRIRSLETGLCGVSLITERGLTQTEVKAPKYCAKCQTKGRLRAKTAGR